MGAVYSLQPAEPATRNITEDFGHVGVRVDAEARTATFTIRYTGRPNFSLDVLRSLQRAQTYVREHYWRAWFTPHRFDLLIWTAEHPEVFNLGGDLAFFLRCLEAGDRKALSGYGRLCVEVVHTNYISMGLPVLTVADIHGDCLGGGFEAALSCDVLLAGEKARFGFPESLFNLFPGMGATSMLTRRIGYAATRRLLLEGRVMGAAETVEAGLADAVLSGEKPEARHNALEGLRRRLTSEMYTRHNLKRALAISRAELDDTVDAWVEAAFRLNAQDIRRMKRFATAQSRL